MIKVDSDAFITKIFIDTSFSVVKTTAYVIHYNTNYAQKIKYSIRRFREIMERYELNTNSYD